MLAYEIEALATEAEAETMQGLQCRDRRQDQDVQSRGRGETETFEISTEARPSRGTNAPRDSLETEASRPRPHRRLHGVDIIQYPISVKLEASLGCNWLTFHDGHEADVVNGVMTSDFCGNLAVVGCSHRGTQLS